MQNTTFTSNGFLKMPETVWGPEYTLIWDPIWDPIWGHNETPLGPLLTTPLGHIPVYSRGRGLGVSRWGHQDAPYGVADGTPYGTPPVWGGMKGVLQKIHHLFTTQTCNETI